MIRQLFSSRRKCVVVDVNTQRDFFLADGAACVRNHRRVLANVRRVMAWARRRHLPIISTCQVFLEPRGENEPAYCIDGSEGQKKVHYTVLRDHISLAADGHDDLPIDILRRYRQVILHKRCMDPFDEPRIDRLLTEMRANEFILIGADAEDAVEATALGLLQRGKRVTIVTDAVGTHDRRRAELAFRKISAKGAHLVETRKLAGKSHLRLVGACKCKSCRSRMELAGEVEANPQPEHV